MEIEEVRRLLENILSKGIHLDFGSYVTLAVITLIGAFVGAYIKKRGENYATKQDFQDILQQVKETTKATEEIKAAISEEQQSKRWEREDKVRFHEERRKLYARFLALADQDREAFKRALQFASAGESKSGSKEWKEEQRRAEEDADKIGIAVLNELGDLYREITLISSPSVVECASMVLKQLRGVTRDQRILYWLFGEGSVTVSSIESIQLSQDEFIKAARIELGISPDGRTL